jgi:uncharacterized repeat protein (TIGR02543 family)
MHTVTIVIGTESRTKLVADGESAELPLTLDIPGYVFKGWDRDFTNITEDCTITAILEPVADVVYTVRFMIDGMAYPVQVKHGETVIPPFTPDFDTYGNPFMYWDVENDPYDRLTNITSDLTVTAVFLQIYN